MTEPTPTAVYVALMGHRPIGASGHLGDVKAAAEAWVALGTATPPEYRWDETFPDLEWQLMRRNEHTKRWGRASIIILAAPIVDAPDVQPDQN